MLRRIGLLGAPLLAGACALSSTMPPLNRDLVQTAPMPTPAPRPPAPAKGSPVVREYDAAQDISRYSVTTHRGEYFLWIQKPRLTFFVVSPGPEIDSLPAVVYLIFRTQSPQEVADSRLELDCDGATSPVGVVPSAKVEPGMLTSSLYQTFELPLLAFRHFAACGTGSVSVGGIKAPFTPAQFHELGELAAVLPAS